MYTIFIRIKILLSLVTNQVISSKKKESNRLPTVVQSDWRLQNKINSSVIVAAYCEIDTYLGFHFKMYAKW